MDVFKILGTVVVTGAASIAEYIWKGPKAESWSFRQHVFFKTVRALSNSKDIVTPKLLQRLSMVPTPVPSSVSIEKLYYTRTKEAIDFCRPLAEYEWHHTASDTDALVETELISVGDGFDSSRIIYMLHGGGYVMGSIQLNRQMAYRMAKRSKSRVFGPNYRLAPQHPFPCGLIDAISGYIFLLRQFEPQNIVLTGDSAGGGLCLSVLYAIRDMGLPMPAGAVLFSPWVDLTHSFQGFFEKGEFDVMPELETLFRFPESVGNRTHLYCPDKALTNPFVSPLFGCPNSLPPLLIQVGEKERLHEEGSAYHEKAIASGVVSILEEYKDQVHIFQAFPQLCNKMPKIAFDRAGRFINQVLQQESLFSQKFLIGHQSVAGSISP